MPHHRYTIKSDIESGNNFIKTINNDDNPKIKEWKLIENIKCFTYNKRDFHKNIASINAKTGINKNNTYEILFKNLSKNTSFFSAALKPPITNCFSQEVADVSFK